MFMEMPFIRSTLTVLTPKSAYTTVKPVLSGHSKIDKTKILMRNGSLMKAESIAEFSCNTFDLR